MPAENIEALQRLPSFSDLAPEALAAFVDQGRWVRLEQGQVLFEEGSSGADLWVVVEGQVAATLGKGDNLVILAAISPGEIVGAIALYRKHSPRPARVTAVEPSLLLRFDTAGLGCLFHDHPELVASVEDAVIQALTRRIRLCNQIVHDALHPPKKGLARAIQSLRGLLGG